MSERGDELLLKDVQEACRRIRAYVENRHYDYFVGDTALQDAVIRNLEIAGEAAKGISAELKAKYPHIAWKEMAGLRDKLIHDYFGVNLDIVWHVVRNEIGDVQARVNEVLKIEFIKG